MLGNKCIVALTSRCHTQFFIVYGGNKQPLQTVCFFLLASGINVGVRPQPHSDLHLPTLGWS